MSGDRGSGTSLGFSRGWVDLPLGRRQKLPDVHILELGSVGDTLGIVTGRLACVKARVGRGEEHRDSL